MVDAKASEGHIDSECGGIVMWSQIRLALGVVLNHKVHDGMTLQSVSCDNHMITTDHTHLGKVSGEDLQLYWHYVFLDELKPLFLKPNLQSVGVVSTLVKWSMYRWRETWFMWMSLVGTFS